MQRLNHCDSALCYNVIVRMHQRGCCTPSLVSRPTGMVDRSRVHNTPENLNNLTYNQRTEQTQPENHSFLRRVQKFVHFVQSGRPCDATKQSEIML